MSAYDTLTTRLKTLTGLPTFVEDNQVFQPAAAQWCRATLLPSEPTPGSIGVGGFDWENGLYQIDIFTPLNTTITPTLANSVISLYPSGLKLAVTDYDSDLEVLRCWLSATRQDKAWHIQSLSVRWRLPRNLGT